MKRKYRLKSWVLVSIYVFSICTIGVSLFMVGKSLKNIVYDDDIQTYVYENVEEDIIPVVSETSLVLRPFTDESVSILKNYYSKDDEESMQESSLILYQNTYMPNTGILYAANNAFDIVAITSGVVENVTDDEIMGKCVTLRYANNIYVSYQSLSDVHIEAGDEVNAGDIIGVSGINKLTSESENMLLLEFSYNGEFIDPEFIYDTDLSILN